MRRVRLWAVVGLLGAGLVEVVMPPAGAARPTPNSVAPVGSLRATSADPGATSGDQFGLAVAKSGVGVGSTVVVGAPGANSSQGAAYIYVKGSSGWPTTPTTTLTDPAATDDDEFGSSVAVSGNTVIVGADGANDAAGAAYIYVEGSSGWPTTPTTTLTDPAATFEDNFGASVAVSGGNAVVGAYGTNTFAGAAYIYVEGSSGWPTAPTATLADPVGGGDFGDAVAVSGGNAVVGAYGTNGAAGAAYIYVEGSSGWPTAPTVTLDDPTDHDTDFFGLSVAVSGNTIVVGAAGTNGLAGAAYIYVEGSSGWPTAPTATLADPAATVDDRFGISVAVSGNTVIVGADGGEVFAGAAYIYVEGSSGWPTTPTATPTDPAPTGFDAFGHSVAVSGFQAVVGAPGTKSSAGVAYVFRSAPAP